MRFFEILNFHCAVKYIESLSGFLEYKMLSQICH